MSNIFSTEIDNNGLAVLTWDDPSGPVNSLAKAAVEAYAQALETLLKDDKVKGIVLTSGKKEFIVGANLHEIQTMEQDAQILLNFVKNLHQLMRLMRSEEHTSELQSRPHLVCRLLLEKKK